MMRPARKSLSALALLSIIGGFLLLIEGLFHFHRNSEEKQSSPVVLTSDSFPQTTPEISLLPITSSSLRRKTTIVTGFFDLAKMGQKTKHPPDFYLEAGKQGVLSLDTPMVVFTDAIDAVRKARNEATHGLEDAKLHIIEMSLSDFEVTKLHLNRISELVRLDPESAAGYSGLLFTTYHAKPEMMAIAAKLNPFKTEKFLWMDVGAIRDWGGIEVSKFKRTKFPDPSREHLLGRNGRILLQGVAGNEGPCTNEALWIDPENVDNIKFPTKISDPITVHETPYVWWIGGSIFGGHGSDLIEYHTLYALHLKRYLQSERPMYSLIDQYMMGALACHTNTIEVVRPPEKCCVDRVNRKWFFLLLYLKWSEFPQKPYTEEEMKSRRPIKGCKYCT